jgi:hypothetical protein
VNQIQKGKKGFNFMEIIPGIVGNGHETSLGAKFLFKLIVMTSNKNTKEKPWRFLVTFKGVR